MENIFYRKITSYKYELSEPHAHTTGAIIPAEIETDFIAMGINGQLVVSKNYAWDGPSGPTIDTPDFMRGSLVHDALYQLMRMKLLPQDFRIIADKELRKICLEDGMTKFRAWYVYHAVRLFAGKAAKPDGPEAESVIYKAPR